MSVAIQAEGVDGQLDLRVRILSERSKLDLQMWDSSACRWMRTQGESVKKKRDTEA